MGCGEQATGVAVGVCRRGLAGGELVAVELGEIVGGHQQPPFGPDSQASTAVKPGELAVLFGVTEQRLDSLTSLAIKPAPDFAV